ncbi:hypothetical protein FA13DRAFT_1451749 [Coprinellus micaceus]|uniref:Uncharacterized protein n=1 Tax=Coprinellus micaceus TaxID=71717 RepID=A0A4Y7SMV4_COPMI|nr:hypothetical protein FA13DRAFT_1451749 [Coprinellus micaceus]
MHPPHPAIPPPDSPAPYGPGVGPYPALYTHYESPPPPVSPRSQPRPLPTPVHNVDVDVSRLGYALPIAGKPNHATAASEHPPRGSPATPVLRASSVRPETRRAAAVSAHKRQTPKPGAASPSGCGGPDSLLFSESMNPPLRSPSTSIPTARDRIDQVILRQEEDALHRNATPTTLVPALPQQKPATPVRLSYAQVADGKKPKVYPPTTVAQPAPALNAPPLFNLPPRLKAPNPGPHSFAQAAIVNSGTAHDERSTRAGTSPTSASHIPKKPSRTEGPSRDSQPSPTPAFGGSPLSLVRSDGRTTQPDTSANSSPPGHVPFVLHNTPSDLPAISPFGLCALVMPPVPNRAPSPSPTRWVTPISSSTPKKSRVNEVKVPYLIYTSPTPKKNAGWERPAGDAGLLKVPQLNLSTGRLPETCQSLGAVLEDADVFNGGSNAGKNPESLAPDSPLTEQTDELDLFSAPSSPSPATTSLSLPEEDDGKEVYIWFHDSGCGDGDDSSEQRGISLLECAYCKSFPQEQEGNPLKQRLKLREIDMVFQVNQVPLPRPSFPSAFY